MCVSVSVFLNLQYLFSDKGPLSDIVTWVIVGCVVMFLVLAAAGVYVKRARILKHHAQHVGESCATYDRPAVQVNSFSFLPI